MANEEPETKKKSKWDKKKSVLPNSKSMLNLSLFSDDEAESKKEKHKNTSKRKTISTWSILGSSDATSRRCSKTLVRSISFSDGDINADTEAKGHDDHRHNNNVTLQTENADSQKEPQTLRNNSSTSDTHMLNSNPKEKTEPLANSSNDSNQSERHSSSCGCDAVFEEDIAFSDSSSLAEKRYTPIYSKQSKSEVLVKRKAYFAKRTKKFHRKFKEVSADEKVINYYVCANVSDFVYQGSLYITPNYFAFYANMLGIGKKILIPIVQVSSLHKEKTAKIIPNALRLETVDGETYFFSSLISRETTYEFMVNMWKKARKLTDSDAESSIPDGVPEDDSFDDAISESGESITDSTDSIRPTSIPSDVIVPVLETQNATNLSSSSPTVATKSSELNPSLKPRLRRKKSRSTSVLVDKKHEKEYNRTQNVFQSSIWNIPSKIGRLMWSIPARAVTNIVSISIAPLQAVRDGLQQITFFEENSTVPLLLGCLLVVILVSTVFMIYRVKSVGEQLATDSLTQDMLYEELLRTHRKLQEATPLQVEKGLHDQLHKLIAVKHWLQTMVELFNKDHSSQSSLLMNSLEEKSSET